ncbi:MAG: ZIP family metal transporter [Oscillospiraceae bacterium]|nr:ZIP family metal transporter [Oscillospiraceae bacterium]
MALIATLFTWSITAAGASLVFVFRKPERNIMDSMLAFAGGVMTAAAFWSLLSPSVELSEKLGMNAALTVVSGFISGGLLLYAGDKIFDNITSSKKNTEHSRFKRCIMLIFSITLHNIPEGLAVGVAFGSLAYEHDNAAYAGAFLIALGIGLQNFPEGTAVSLPLMREGISRKKSFVIGQLSGIVEPVAGVTGALLVSQMRNLLPFLLAFAAGAMIYVVAEEIIPESQTNERKDRMALFTIIGFSVMMLLDVALG